MTGALGHPWVNTRPLSLTTDSDRSLFAWSSNVGRADAGHQRTRTAPQGLEPRLAGPGPTVLPLHQSAKRSLASSRNADFNPLMSYRRLGYRRAITKKTTAGVKQIRLSRMGKTIPLILSRGIT